jgi:hypothetical protein
MPRVKKIFIGYPFVATREDTHRVIEALIFISDTVKLETGAVDIDTRLGKDDTYHSVTFSLPTERLAFEEDLVSGKYDRMWINLRKNFLQILMKEDVDINRVLVSWDLKKDRTLQKICDSIENCLRRQWPIYWHNVMVVGFAGPHLALITHYEEVTSTPKLLSELAYHGSTDVLTIELRKMRDTFTPDHRPVISCHTETVE